MSGEIDALGNLADAALVARSLEPEGGLNHAAVADAHHRCANCDAPLTGNFCASCGQKAHVHRSLLHVGEELLHGITHFDGKAWTTLPLLIFRPGKLTREYIEGRRARYIAPVPLFLLVVFLMFFVFSFVGIKDNVSGEISQKDAKAELPRIEAELAAVDKKIAAAKANPKPGELAGLEAERTGLLVTRKKLDERARGIVDTPADIPGEIAQEIRDGDAKVHFGIDALDQKAATAVKNPELAIYKIQSKAYKLSFLLVPLSLPWLWLMFAWKRGIRMYDHAVFTLYSISFMSLLFIVCNVALSLNIDTPWFWVPVLTAPLFHMYAQLKGTYGLTRFGAVWRTGALWICAVTTLALYAVLMIALGVLD